MAQGVSQNYAEAAKWYGLSAKKGNLDGQINLGLIKKDGKGVPENKKEAIKWFRLAADD